MSKKTRVSFKKGFTIIEVSLFLAISGLIIVGMVASTSGTLSTRRYDDAVQDFASFLGGLYSSATNVQNTNGCSDDFTNQCGRSEQAVYGYIAIFGRDEQTTVYTYNLRGEAQANLTEDDNTLNAALRRIHINIDRFYQEGEQSVEVRRIYNPIWESTIEDSQRGHLYRGAIAIIRSPLDGTLYTRTYTEGQVAGLLSSNANVVTETIVNGSSTQPANFCIENPDLGTRDRRNVRVQANGRTASAVEIIARDSEDNVCR